MIPFLRRHAFPILFVIAAAMRLLFIWRAPLWYDENFTLLMLRLPLPRMGLAILGDVHPPLFYLLWSPLGHIPNAPAWIIRLPSALFSIAALELWWLLLKRLVSSSPVRWAAWLLMAISSTQIFYAQEGRMYALLTFLVIAATLALVCRKWIWLGLLSLALLYTHNYAIFYVACLWAAGMLRNRRDWKPLTLSLGVAGMNWLLWLPVLRSQMATIQPAYWIVTPTLGNTLYDLYQSFFLHAELRVDIWNMTVFFGWLAFAIAWCIIQRKRIFCVGHHWINNFTPPTEPYLSRPPTLSIIGYSSSAKYFGVDDFTLDMWLATLINTNLPFLLVMAFGTFGLALLASLLWSPLMLYRALVPMTPFVGLFLVLPFVQIIQKRRAALLAAVLIVPVLVLNAARMYVKSDAIKSADDYKVLQIVQYIDSHWQPGDVVFHLGDGSYVNMTPYAAHPESHVKMIPCGPTRGELSPLTRLALGEQVVDLGDIHTGRVWLFTNESPMTPQCEEDFADTVTEGLQPVLCLRDDEMVNECLYLLEEHGQN